MRIHVQGTAAGVQVRITEAGITNIPLAGGAKVSGIVLNDVPLDTLTPEEAFNLAALLCDQAVLAGVARAADLLEKRKSTAAQLAKLVPPPLELVKEGPAPTPAPDAEKPAEVLTPDMAPPSGNA